jgi:hypothetical protein
VSSARIISRSPSETTAEQEARARAWAYVFDCYCKKEATRPGGPDAVKRSSMIRDTAIVAHEPNLLASVRELYSDLPEARILELHELQGTLWLLDYTSELAPEGEIAAAVEVTRGDEDPEGAAA